jgi:pre-mRNA-splicing helicase BRR2
MYRRLTQNPNYYSLHEISGVAINNYLSELTESTIDELHESKCIAVEEDNELEAINSGIIANYYYVSIETVKNFSDKINAGSKLKDLLFILSEAKEFEIIKIRNGEENLLA